MCEMVARINRELVRSFFFVFCSVVARRLKSLSLSLSLPPTGITKGRSESGIWQKGNNPSATGA
jgi:hypothetical protein